MSDEEIAAVSAEPAAAPVKPAPLPGRVTAAGVILLVFGTLSALSSALALLWSLLVMTRMGMGFVRFNDGPGGFGGDGFGGGVGWPGILFIALAVAVAVAVAGGHLAAGWGVLQRFAWARLLGMVVSGTALVIIVLGVLGTLVWVATFPDLREFERIPEWFADWARTMVTAGVSIGVLVSLFASAAYGFVLWVLARADEDFV